MCDQVVDEEKMWLCVICVSVRIGLWECARERACICVCMCLNVHCEYVHFRVRAFLYECVCAKFMIAWVGGKEGGQERK